MSALPLDLIRSKILHPHIRRNNPEGKSLLAARAACVSFWKALPVGEMLGIREETAKWLLMGECVPWKNTSTTTASLMSDKKIKVKNAGITWVTASPENRFNAAVHDGKDLRGFATIFTPQRKTLPLIELVIICNCKGVLRLQDSAYFLTAIVVVQDMMYLISSLGTVFSINVTEIYNDPSMHTTKRTNFLQHIHSKKLFDVPYGLPGLENRFRLKDARTSNGDLFLFLTEQGYLLCGNLSQPIKKLTILARGVHSFMLVDNAALCRLDNGSLVLFNAALNDVVHARIANDVESFMSIPELKTLWMSAQDNLFCKKAAVNISF